jgi:arginine/lysine/ornithine decarboxylase
MGHGYVVVALQSLHERKKARKQPPIASCVQGAETLLVCVQESVLGFDPLRIVVNVQGLGLTGYDAAAWLEEKHGIVPELSTNKVRHAMPRLTCCEICVPLLS